jgi:hypothetical protein
VRGSGTRLEAVRGDITEQVVDATVNTGNLFSGRDLAAYSGALEG